MKRDSTRWRMIEADELNHMLAHTFNAIRRLQRMRAGLTWWNLFGKWQVACRIGDLNDRYMVLTRKLAECRWRLGGR